MKKIASSFLALALSACMATPTVEATSTSTAPIVVIAEDNPYAPRPEDNSLQIAGIVLSSIDLSERIHLTPARVELGLSGSLPSVCNQLRLKVTPPDAQYQIFLEAYSVVNLDQNCENVFQQFEASILFGVYSAGRYTVWVNGGLVGDFIVY